MDELGLDSEAQKAIIRFLKARESNNMMVKKLGIVVNITTTDSKDSISIVYDPRMIS